MAAAPTGNRSKPAPRWHCLVDIFHENRENPHDFSATAYLFRASWKSSRNETFLGRFANGNSICPGCAHSVHIALRELAIEKVCTVRTRFLFATVVAHSSQVLNSDQIDFTIGSGHQRILARFGSVLSTILDSRRAGECREGTNSVHLGAVAKRWAESVLAHPLTWPLPPQF